MVVTAVYASWIIISITLQILKNPMSSSSLNNDSGWMSLFFKSEYWWSSSSLTKVVKLSLFLRTLILFDVVGVVALEGSDLFFSSNSFFLFSLSILYCSRSF